jgi:hypothetical protein
MKKILLFFVLTGCSFGLTAQNQLTISNGIEINSGSNNGSGLKFTNLNATSAVSQNAPAKLLTLDNSGNVVLGNVPTIPVGASLWSVNGSNVASTTASSIVVGGTVPIPSGNPYGLYVARGILTEKVRVAGSASNFWADYVFDKTYQLPSLKNVEQFIKVNKHLPNVPSTAEVSENGIELFEMQATLLRKIEELTLYSIKQSKQIASLERKMNKMKKK